MSHIVRTFLIVQISIIICLCIGLSPLFAGAQDNAEQWELNAGVHRIVAQPVKEEPAAVTTGQGEHKIAVFQIVDEAGMDPRDVSTLGTILERAVKEFAHGRYGIVVMEPAQEGEYCDDNCMMEKAGAKGATFVVHGKLSSFGSGQILSLELVTTNGAAVVASAVTNVVSLEKLPGETRVAAELLIARSPFAKPAIKGSTSGGVMAARARMLNWSSRPAPPDYKGTRIAAHIFFWGGLDVVGAGFILLDAGAEEAAIGFFVGGGLCVFIATVCAVKFSKLREKRKEWDRTYGGQLYGGPIITPDFAGMGLAKSF